MPLALPSLSGYQAPEVYPWLYCLTPDTNKPIGSSWVNCLEFIVRIYCKKYFRTFLILESYMFKKKLFCHSAPFKFWVVAYECKQNIIFRIPDNPFLLDFHWLEDWNLQKTFIVSGFVELFLFWDQLHSIYFHFISLSSLRYGLFLFSINRNLLSWYLPKTFVLLSYSSSFYYLVIISIGCLLSENFQNLYFFGNIFITFMISDENYQLVVIFVYFSCLVWRRYVRLRIYVHQVLFKG